MTSDGASLLAYCHEHPDDDQARLVYADWLEEHDDEAQAEFIRLQLHRAALWPGHPDDDDLEPREKDLLDAHGDRWRTGLRCVDLSDNDLGDESLRVLARSPLTRRLRVLKCSDMEGTTTQGLKALLDAVRPGTLEGLSLWRMGLGDDAARALAESPALCGVRRLWLGHNRIGPDGAAALACSPHLTALRELFLVVNRIGDRGAEALLDSPLLDRLEFLNVESNRISKPVRQRLRDRRPTTWSLRT